MPTPLAFGRNSSGPPRDGRFAPRIAPPPNWKAWRVDYRWGALAAAYDDWLQQEEDEALEILRREARASQIRFELEREQFQQQMARSAARKALALLEAQSRW